MVLDVTNHELTQGKYYKKTFHLTSIEQKIVLLLSDNVVHSLEEIQEYCEISKECVRTHVYYMKKKIKELTIITVKERGYRLENSIWITSTKPQKTCKNIRYKDNFLRKKLNEKNMSQTELATRLGVSKQYVNCLCSNKIELKRLNIDIQGAIATILDIPYSEFAKGVLGKE